MVRGVRGPDGSHARDHDLGLLVELDVLNGPETQSSGSDG
jgi:hypothetical protein